VIVEIHIPASQLNLTGNDIKFLQKGEILHYIRACRDPKLLT
jgi:hypothetical protein